MLSLLFVFLGCVGQEENTTPKLEKEGKECTSTTDCAQFQVCSKGKCVYGIAPCNSSEDCKNIPGGYCDLERFSCRMNRY